MLEQVFGDRMSLVCQPAWIREDMLESGNLFSPLLLILFISPIANVINSDQSNQNSIVSFRQYADDTQLYIVTKACYFHIRALRHIRASLTIEASQTIAAAIVGSRLDYCNSLLAGTCVSNLACLQRVQNTLSLVVEQKPRFCHITPVLPDLHLLPVRHRISFISAMVTFKVLQFQQPSYLASLIPRYVPTQALCCSSSLSICVPPRKITMAASKSFSFVASGIWNALPNHNNNNNNNNPHPVEPE